VIDHPKYRTEPDGPVRDDVLPALFLAFVLTALSGGIVGAAITAWVLT
jgi:hypothetical protein